MGFADSIRGFFEGLRERFRKPEPEEETAEEWGSVEAEEEPVAVVKPPEPESWGKKHGGWPSLRMRVFGAVSVLVIVVNLAALVFFAFAPQAVAIIAVAYLLPNTLILIHYRRLLGRVKTS